MPAGVGYPPQGQGAPPPEAMMAGMDSILAQGAGPPGATDPPSGEGSIETQVISTLAQENAQLRALIGLGPDDPIPDPQASAPAPGASPPASSQPGAPPLPPAG